MALAVIGIQFAASAQEKRDTIRSHYKSEARTKMKDELNLTKEQSQKMKEIKEDTKAKMQALRDDKSLSDADRKQKSAAIMKESMEKRNAILNDEQKAKMKEWQAKRKDHMKKDGERKHKGHKGKVKTEKEAEKTEQ